MHKFDETKLNAFKALATILSKTKAGDPIGNLRDTGAGNGSTNIFELARAISERAYSRRRLRRASSIF